MGKRVVNLEISDKIIHKLTESRTQVILIKRNLNRKNIQNVESLRKGFGH